jgi:hypothetical protein
MVFDLNVQGIAGHVNLNEPANFKGTSIFAAAILEFPVRACLPLRYAHVSDVTEGVADECAARIPVAVRTVEKLLLIGEGLKSFVGDLGQAFETGNGGKGQEVCTSPAASLICFLIIQE